MKVQAEALTPVKEAGSALIVDEVQSLSASALALKAEGVLALQADGRAFFQFLLPMNKFMKLHTKTMFQGSCCRR